MSEPRHKLRRGVELLPVEEPISGLLCVIKHVGNRGRLGTNEREVSRYIQLAQARGRLLMLPRIVRLEREDVWVEYVNGPNLHKYYWVDDRDYVFEERVLMAHRCLRVIADMHQQCLYHGDVSPRNLVVLDDAQDALADEDGIRVVPIDFESAHIRDETTPAWQQPLVVHKRALRPCFKANYAPPELRHGTRTDTVNVQAVDSFQLGVLVYLLLEDKLPFCDEYDDFHECLYQHVLEHGVATSIPKLKDLVDRLMGVNTHPSRMEPFCALAHEFFIYHNVMGALPESPPANLPLPPQVTTTSNNVFAPRLAPAAEPAFGAPQPRSVRLPRITEEQEQGPPAPAFNGGGAAMDTHRMMAILKEQHRASQKLAASNENLACKFAQENAMLRARLQHMEAVMVYLQQQQMAMQQNHAHQMAEQQRAALAPPPRDAEQEKQDDGDAKGYRLPGPMQAPVNPIYEQ